MATPINGELVNRAEKVAFIGVPGEDTVTYKRMRGFTELSKSANPQEYSRKYIDELYERSDVVGYSPSFSYAFDLFRGNPVHEEFAKIADEELVGTAAVRSIIIVDMTQEGAASGAKKAVKRDFSVIPDSEGSEAEAYTYSGNLKVNGDAVNGSAKSEDGWQTITFTEDTPTA